MHLKASPRPTIDTDRTLIQRGTLYTAAHGAWVPLIEVAESYTFHSLHKLTMS